MQTNRAESLLTFLDDSPCNFLAVNTIKNELLSNGFIELDASDKWNLAKGGKYFVVKNDSAIYFAYIFSLFLSIQNYLHNLIIRY